jgi:hypothetical protein
MVELETGVMVRQRLNRRIADKPTTVSAIVAWERHRNREQARIEWMFTVERAREKLGRAYPSPASHVAIRAIKLAG